MKRRERDYLNRDLGLLICLELLKNTVNDATKIGIAKIHQPFLQSNCTAKIIKVGKSRDLLFMLLEISWTMKN